MVFEQGDALSRQIKITSQKTTPKNELLIKTIISNFIPGYLTRIFRQNLKIYVVGIQ